MRLRHPARQKLSASLLGREEEKRTHLASFPVVCSVVSVIAALSLAKRLSRPIKTSLTSLPPLYSCMPCTIAMRTLLCRKSQISLHPRKGRRERRKETHPAAILPLLVAPASSLSNAFANSPFSTNLAAASALVCLSTLPSALSVARRNFSSFELVAMLRSFGVTATRASRGS